MGRKRQLPWKGSLIFSAVVVMAVVSVMVFVPTAQVPTEIGALIAGLVAGAYTTRFGFPRRWIGSLVLLLFVVIWFLLGESGYAWFGGFLAGALAGVAWGRAIRNRAVTTAVK